MLTKESIQANEPGPLGKNLKILQQTGSTNDDVKELARRGAPAGLVLIADHQSAGRGRLGRHWQTPPGVNIALSLLLDLEEIELKDAPVLALVIGLAVSEALESTAGLETGLKWPNDVLAGEGRQRKICGVLVEALQHRPDRNLQPGVIGPATRLVIGVGLNVNQERFDAELEDIATSLLIETGHRHARSTLVAALLRRIHRRLLDVKAGAVAELLAEWSNRSSTLGRMVRTPDGLIGRVVGVSRQGALLLHDEVGTTYEVLGGPLEMLEASTL